MEEEQEPKRQIKPVSRSLPIAELPRVKSELQIPNGSGSFLRDVPGVVEALTKVKSDDDDVVLLHRFLFGRPGEKNDRKGNIRSFFGFANDENMERKAEILSSWNIDSLKWTLGLCSLPTVGNKAELISRVLGFLQKPSVPAAKKAVVKTPTASRPAKKARVEGGSPGEDGGDGDGGTPLLLGGGTGAPATLPKAKLSYSTTPAPHAAQAAAASNAAAFELYLSERREELLRVRSPVLAELISCHAEIEACLRAEMTIKWKALPEASRASYGAKAGSLGGGGGKVSFAQAQVKPSGLAALSLGGAVEAPATSVKAAKTPKSALKAKSTPAPAPPSAGKKEKKRKERPVEAGEEEEEEPAVGTAAAKPATVPFSVRARAKILFRAAKRAEEAGGAGGGGDVDAAWAEASEEVKQQWYAQAQAAAPAQVEQAEAAVEGAGDAPAAATQAVSDTSAPHDEEEEEKEAELSDLE